MGSAAVGALPFFFEDAMPLSSNYLWPLYRAINGAYIFVCYAPTLRLAGELQRTLHIPDQPISIGERETWSRTQ